MELSTFQKAQLGLVGILGVGGALFFVGFVAPFGGRHTSAGSVQSFEAREVSMIKGGETLSAHRATLYAIVLDAQTEPLLYQEPAAKPTLAKGQRVSVTWAKRGLFGKPLVYEVK
jgi:hypothetical protein